MKYKYYFKKPRSEIVKDILYWLLVAGLVLIASTSPYFVKNLMREIKKFRKYKKETQKVSDTFWKLKKRGLIKIEKKKNQIYIYLTEKGKKLASWLQINDLEIKKPKKWDKKWRLVIFDISQLKKIYREAFRGKLKELGFYCLQKSVWVHAFECRDEIELLRDFFGLTKKEVCLLVAEKIDNEKLLKEIFNVK